MADDAIETFAWGQYPQPFWNETNSVPRAVKMLSEAGDEKQAGDAYNEILQAFGNRRTATYWPVVLAGMQFLKEILNGPDEWARAAVLDVLIELTVCYAPEPGFEKFRGSKGPLIDVAKDLKRMIVELLPRVKEIAESPNSADREKERAEELIFCLSGSGGPLG